MNKIITRILEDVSLDPRIEDGIFDIKNNNHIGYLYEYFLNKNIDNNVVLDFIQLLLEKGKYPERQAYNSKGLLVTFPTPEYKKRAIERGTHFETNPINSQSNLFGGGQAAPNEPTPVDKPTQTSTDSSLPRDSGDSAEPETPKKPEQKPEPQPVQPPISPQSSSEGELEVEPQQQSQPPPNVSQPSSEPQKPAVKKTPTEIEAEKEVIKQILSSTDTLPTVPGVGESSLKEELKKISKISIEMNLDKAAKFLLDHL